MTEAKETIDLRTLDIRPRYDTAVKPAELIQISGHETLSLNARRAITLLWHNAHQQGIEAGKDYTIEIDDLKTSDHKGYEMVEEAVVALMKTILTVRLPNGKTRRTQFLGGNDLDAPERPAGVFTYSFDKKLVEILKDSAIWGKIALPVLMAFSSKYSVTLYEHIAQWVNLTHKTMQEFTLEEFRTAIGVEEGKYPMFGAFNRHVLRPVILEINALAPFNITVLPIKQGKKVEKIALSWWPKTKEEQAQAHAELNRSKIGRKARIAQHTDVVLPPMPSANRLLRKGRKEFAQRDAG